MTGWTIPLFRMAETEVRLHPTFFLLLAIVGITSGLQGIAFVSLLFVCVLLHEFGHVFAARRYGIRTPDITLWPFGGVASLERMPEQPLQEIVVALAGPAVNVGIVLVLTVIGGVAVDWRQAGQLDQAQASLLTQLTVANVILVLFNLIPAFPMDGGRVLRAVLAIRFGYSRATRVAATIGQILAVGLGLLGLSGNPMLVIIAVFVFLAASSEAGFVQARDLTRAHLARDAMITRFESLAPWSTANDAAKLLLSTTQQEFPVRDNEGRLLGFVTRDGIIQALSGTGADTPVSPGMLQATPSVSPQAPLDAVFSAMQRDQSNSVAVVDAYGRLLGYINRQNMSEFVLIESTLRARRAS